MWKVTKRKCLLWISNILKYIKKSTSPHRYFEHVFFCHTTFRSKSVGLLSMFRNENVTSGYRWFLGIFSQIKRHLRENFEVENFFVLPEKFTWWYENIQGSTNMINANVTTIFYCFATRDTNCDELFRNIISLNAYLGCATCFLNGIKNR